MIDPRTADPAEAIAAYLDAKAQHFADRARRKGGRGDGMTRANALQVAAADTLYADTSRPFERPGNRKIAVKVINQFGDEVMKVFGV